MQAILRFDDYSAESDTALERRILDVIANAGRRIVVSVVPFIAEINWQLRGPIELRALPRDKIALLKTFVPQTVEIALHGYCHQAISRTSGLSEFGDSISFERQVQRLKDGKHWLEDHFGVPIQTFVPPWNMYGVSTLQAAIEAEFHTVSADAASGPVKHGLAYVPATCSVHELRGAARLGTKTDGALTCALLHEFDFSSTGRPDSLCSLSDLKTLCLDASIKKWSTTGDYSTKESGYERAMLNQELRRTLHSPIRRLFPRHTGHIYWPLESVRAKLKQVRMMKRLVVFSNALSG